MIYAKFTRLDGGVSLEKWHLCYELIKLVSHGCSLKVVRFPSCNLIRHLEYMLFVLCKKHMIHLGAIFGGFFAPSNLAAWFLSVCGELMSSTLHSPFDVKSRSHCIHPTGAFSVSYREVLSQTYLHQLLSHSRLLKGCQFSRGRSSAIRFCWRFRRPRCVCTTERDGLDGNRSLLQGISKQRK